MSCPLDYSLCDQKTTVYRLKYNTVTRTILTNCSVQWLRKKRFDALGTVCETAFVMIVPGDTADIQPGDRIYMGTGPYIAANGWKDFVPENVPGLAQVAYVKPCYWENEICHIEVGSKQGGAV